MFEFRKRLGLQNKNNFVLIDVEVLIVPLLILKEMYSESRILQMSVFQKTCTLTQSHVHHLTPNTQRNKTSISAPVKAFSDEEMEEETLVHSRPDGYK